MKKSSNTIMFLLSILVGVILGGIIGKFLGQYIEILNYGKSIGIENFQLDLEIIRLNFGFIMELNLAGIIGIIISIIIFRKL